MFYVAIENANDLLAKYLVTNKENKLGERVSKQNYTFNPKINNGFLFSAFFLYFSISRYYLFILTNKANSLYLGSQQYVLKLQKCFSFGVIIIEPKAEIGR